MDSSINYESKKLSPLISEIKQFPTKTIEKQTTGLKRSITTAAIFAFIIPAGLFILYILWPFAKYPVDLYIEQPNNGDIAVLHVENSGFSVIERMTINLEYGDFYIRSVSYDVPDSCYAEVSKIGIRRKENDNSNDAPFRCAFKVENLAPDDVLKIKLKLDSQVLKTNTLSPLKPGKISDPGVFIPWWPRWKLFNYFFSRNFVYFLLLLLGLYAAFYLLLLYTRSLRNSRTLEACLTYIIGDFRRPRETTPGWMYKTMENLFLYWMRIGEEEKSAPPELRRFRSFVMKYDMMKESENRSVIYFAPFDVLGSPTFTRLLSKNRKVLFLEFESGKLQRYRVAMLKELLVK